MPGNARKSLNGDAAGRGVRSGVIAVMGMHREAQIAERGGEAVVSGGDNSSLAAKIEAAIARGGRAVISFGICGGLVPALPVGAVVIGSEVVWEGARMPTDARWRNALAARLPLAVTGAVAGANAILADGGAKRALYRESGALAVDMESHIAARVAAAHGLPFAILRVVSDTSDYTLPPAALDAIGPDGKPKIANVLRSVLAKPSQIPALIRTARDSERALAELFRCLDLLGPGFLCPYLG